MKKIVLICLLPFTMSFGFKFSILNHIAATSCKELLQKKPLLLNNDGIYLFDVNNDGIVDSNYCDMTTNGGGWTLLALMRDDTKFGYADVFWTNYGSFNNSIANINPNNNTSVSVATSAAGSLVFDQLRAVEKVTRYDTSSYNGSCYNFVFNETNQIPAKATIWKNNINSTWKNSTGFVFTSGSSAINLNKEAYTSKSYDYEVRARWGSIYVIDAFGANPQGFGLRQYGQNHSCHRSSQWGGYLNGYLSYESQGNHSSSIDIYAR